MAETRSRPVTDERALERPSMAASGRPIVSDATRERATPGGRRPKIREDGRRGPRREGPPGEGAGPGPLPTADLGEPGGDQRGKRMGSASDQGDLVLDSGRCRSRDAVA